MRFYRYDFTDVSVFRPDTTYTVQKLEQDLDVVLFDRGGHRARLTPAGEKLLKDGRHLLRAAEALEAAVQRVATGWEAELKIVVGDLIPLPPLYPIIAEFYKEERGTQLRIGHEVLGGVWDALVSGRADLVIGASGDGPAGGGYATRSIGQVGFVFVVVPHHPLAQAPEPLHEEAILCHRAVAAADSSRHLPPRTSALLTGQDVLTVPDLQAKCEAHRLGLGVGYVPRYMVQKDIDEKRLLVKQVETAIPNPQIVIAWRTADVGKALKWFLDRLDDPELFKSFVGR